MKLSTFLSFFPERVAYFQNERERAREYVAASGGGRSDHAAYDAQVAEGHEP